MTPPGAVTFDFWNTIAHEPPGLLSSLRRDAVLAACVDCGVRVDEDALADHLAAVGRDHHEAWSAGRLYRPATAAQTLTEALGLQPPASERVARAFLDASRDAKLEVAPGVHESLVALRDRGVRLAIVCDVGLTSGELLRGFLRRRGMLELFDGWAFSDEVGAYKPSPLIFHHALEALGVEPARAVHVGDLRRTDVAGARAAGMGTVRYRGLVDDPDVHLPEADRVVDAHDELPEVLA